MKKSIAAILIACFALGGCTSRIVDFTIISTKNFNFSKAANYKRGPNRVIGEDLAHWIIIVPTKKIDIKEAIDNTIEATPGCVALLDGVVYSKFWWIPYIYGQQSYIVEGTPLIEAGASGELNDNPTYKKLVIDSKGKVKKIENLTPENYSYMKSKIIKDSDLQSFENSDMISQ